ncbi:hypothetical protein F2Q69_00008004 [Brassica cretica]|uniref:Uncharacterized protein n=1 Tax=Brassica cretica TaxID=69181 RepID=A0A8S9P0V2_BRACR|nr:hypothetical protein F2Q69_00008004 [Brassica cretica]
MGRHNRMFYCSAHTDKFTLLACNNFAGICFVDRLFSGLILTHANAILSTAMTSLLHTLCPKALHTDTKCLTSLFLINTHLSPLHSIHFRFTHKHNRSSKFVDIPIDDDEALLWDGQSIVVYYIVGYAREEKRKIEG